MTDFQKIGKYEVTEKIGEGSFGVVYRGRDPFLKREVAIKVCTLADEGLRKRFLREAEIAGKLEHKNIVRVFAFGFEGEVPYLVQEYLSGRDLREVIQRRTPMLTADKLEVLLQVADGLGYAHRQGVVHRDVKPANVRLLDDGTAKIMDFGIAKLASAETQLTQAGVTMGTATYLPPEQVRGGEIDRRADVFSFGVLTHELLTCQRPFRGSTLSALVYQILYKPPQPIAEVWRACPPPLAKLVERCLEKDPAGRYPDMDSVAAELTVVRDRLLAGEWPAAAATPTPPESDGDESVAEARTVRLQRPRSAPDKESTQPIAAIAAAPKPATQKPAATEVMPPPLPPAAPKPAVSKPVAPKPAAPKPAPPRPPVPPSAAPPPAAGEEVAREAGPGLSMTAQEIQKLVAQGDLEAARRQLEETIARQRRNAGTPAAGTPPAGTPAADLPDAALDPTLTRRPTIPSASPGAPQPGRPPWLAGWKRWAVAGGGVVAALILIVAVGSMFDRGEVEESEPERIVAVPPPPEAIGDPGPVLEAVAVNALPWAEVTEITDGEGFVRNLPEVTQTPLRLLLPAGGYRISLRHPEHAEVAICEVEVVPAEPASCAVAFGEASVLQYFKDSGWWN